MELCVDIDSSDTDAETILTKLLYTIQFLWLIAILNPSARIPSKLTNLEIIITQHLWIMTSQSLFLQSNFFTSAKEKGFRVCMICSMIAGAATRLLASLPDWGIDILLTRSENEVYKFVERMLFEPKLDLMMTCGISPRELLMRWHFCVCGCYAEGLGG
jgi:hypothetical protein